MFLKVFKVMGLPLGIWFILWSSIYEAFLIGRAGEIIFLPRSVTYILLWQCNFCFLKFKGPWPGIESFLLVFYGCLEKCIFC